MKENEIATIKYLAPITHFAVYEHKIISDTNKISTYRAIVIKDLCGYIVDFTGLELFVTPYAGHTPMADFRSRQELIYICQALNYIFSHYHIRKITEITADMLIEFLRDYAQTPKTPGTQLFRSKQSVEKCLWYVSNFFANLSVVFPMKLCAEDILQPKYSMRNPKSLRVDQIYVPRLPVKAETGHRIPQLRDIPEEAAWRLVELAHMLALKIVRDGYVYKEEVVTMDDEIIAQSKAVFSDMVAHGVIKAQSYNSHQWQMSDEVKRNVVLNFRLDEVHFAREARKQLNCTLAQYQQAMRLVATSCFGFSLDYIQSAVTAMRNYADLLKPPSSYEAGQIVADLLCLLPGDSAFRMRTIDKILNNSNSTNEKGQPRQLAHYQSYMEFDRYLDKFWSEATEQEQIIYFPVYFWYKVTGIIPLRPTECVLTPRNCIRRDEAGAHLSLRRTKLKGTQQSCRYNIDEDYEKVEYRIPDGLAQTIEEYIMRTQDVYQSDIDVLFCKASQFDGLNITHDNDEHYTYGNLNQCLSHFYNKILVGRFSLTIVSDVDLLLDGEIERISLGDTRHLALISLSATTRDPIICQELAGHINADMQTHYSSNRKKFLDALGYIRIREMHSRLPSKNTLITSDILVNGGKGYCTNYAIRCGDYSKCAHAVDAYGMAGNCDVCENFLPNSRIAAITHKANAEKEHEAVCKLYCKTLEQLRQGLGNHETLVSILDRLAATEDKYVCASAIERMITQHEEQSEKERPPL